jgi:peptidyl-prolyl isomerase D
MSLARYLALGGDEQEIEKAQTKLEPTVLSCILNTAACKLKLQLWQEAMESCDEVSILGQPKS